MKDRGRPRGTGMGPAGLTCVRVSQKSVLILAAPQRGSGRRLILWQPREAGDAHVVHGRVGAQGALLTGLVLRRHPRPRPPATQRLPEVVRRGPGGGRGLSSEASWKGRLTPTLARLAPACLALSACSGRAGGGWGCGCRAWRAGPGLEVRTRGKEHATSSPRAKSLPPSSLS